MEPINEKGTQTEVLQGIAEFINEYYIVPSNHTKRGQSTKPKKYRDHKEEAKEVFGVDLDTAEIIDQAKFEAASDSIKYDLLPALKPKPVTPASKTVGPDWPN